MYIKRYTNYIKEDLDNKSRSELSSELAERLKKDCAPFIEEMSKYREFMYRGSDKYTDYYDIRDVRKNRRPRNTEVEMSSHLDSLFVEKFGIALRRQTVFTTNREQDTGMYGNSYLFFPIGNYEFYWSEDVDDLFGLVADFEFDFNTEEELDEGLRKIVDTYNKGDIKGAIRSEVEVMYDCKNYYMVNTKYESELMKLLFGKDEY